MQGAVGREGGTLQFDRILCDVPCSGDGTMRKAPDIWRRWTASNGNGLHALQINITLRACQLLKVCAVHQSQTHRCHVWNVGIQAGCLKAAKYLHFITVDPWLKDW